MTLAGHTDAWNTSLHSYFLSLRFHFPPISFYRCSVSLLPGPFVPSPSFPQVGMSARESSDPPMGRRHISILYFTTSSCCYHFCLDCPVPTFPSVDADVLPSVFPLFIISPIIIPCIGYGNPHHWKPPFPILTSPGLTSSMLYTMTEDSASPLPKLH